MDVGTLALTRTSIRLPTDLPTCFPTSRFPASPLLKFLLFSAFRPILHP
jgi:hypothetical protein